MLSKKTNRTNLIRNIRHNVHSFGVEYRCVKDRANTKLMYMERLLTMPTQIKLYDALAYRLFFITMLMRRYERPSN